MLIIRITIYNNYFTCIIIIMLQFIQHAHNILLMPLLLCICERFLLVDEFVRVDLNASILYWVVSGVQMSSLHSFSISAPF